MTDIEQAIERGETQLHYQPIVSLATGHLIGFEAFLRWLRPEYGLLLPAVFMPRPDEQDAIVALTRWGLRRVCEDVRLWQAAEPRRPFIVSVNVLNCFLNNEERLEEIAALTQGIAPSFAAEISEPQSMADIEEFSQQLCFLARSGIRLYLDNFGTAFSPVAVLADLPLAGVKVDRTLVERLPADDKALKIIRALVAFALSLDREVIATGVETSEQAEIMKGLDCQFAQGYYFSAPVDAGRALALLRRGVIESQDQRIQASRLCRFDLFAGLADDALAEIGRACQERSVARGTVLIRQGQVGNELYLLDQGEISVYRERKGSLQELAVVQAPAVFGEMAVFHPERIRTASVEASSDLRLLAIPVDVFLYFLRRWPTLKCQLQQLIARRLSR